MSHWWGWLLLASAACFALKWAGYTVPSRWLHNPRMAQVAGSMTVALLSALTVMNTVAAGPALVLDARVAALAAAALALLLRAPFLWVVVVGAAAAAAVRALGWAA